ncbi:MAG: hypothetical protein HUK03_03105, partial [Bacteroidaceae bacterium]|nr:hypothetical protein [Bacteroidaceae bacterium]
EVVVDNDTPEANGKYVEQNGKYEWEAGGTGFAHTKTAYFDGENPFQMGTFRRTEAHQSKKMLSSVRWQPNIPEEGDYAVYVSYQTLLNSVSDATYIVRHQGVATEYKVNQQMGGGTWVYLGTFRFDKGDSYNNCVILTNQSNYRGVITADAVRFGGGMGNVARMDSTMQTGVLSGLPRCDEGARYNALWSGFPIAAYHARDNDYNDDIAARSAVENYLSRGSVFVPGDSGLCVPIEMSVGIHSDAGYSTAGDIIGTLGIYTTDYNEGLTGCGLSRLTSRDLVDAVVTQVSNDLTRTFGLWNRRQLLDRNYGESRDPMVPAVIVEMLSHQNWADMRMGHDPFFKFVLARAIYKGILRHIAYTHNIQNPTVQPMPVSDLSAEVMMDKDQVRLSWEETIDEYEKTAKPTHYVIYRADGNRGFDNGTIVPANTTSVDIDIAENTLYRFMVTAVNSGGESARSEEVCAYKASGISQNILIVDGFQRIAGPKAFDTDSIGGFDMQVDAGVADVKTPGFCGYQVNFDKKNYGKIDEQSYGFSGAELEGKILAGNTHNYCSLHAADILQTGVSLSISSCVGNALDRLNLNTYKVMDIVMGAQKVDGYSLRYYKTFPPQMCNTLLSFTQNGGHILLSGAYIGTDMQLPEEQDFTHNVLKYDLMTTISTDSIGYVRGMNTHGTLYNTPNEANYWIRRADVLQPVDEAFCTMVYHTTNYPAAIAYAGKDYRAMSFGFPLECVKEPEIRMGLFSASLRFLLEK